MGERIGINDCSLRSIAHFVGSHGLMGRNPGFRLRLHPGLYSSAHSVGYFYYRPATSIFNTAADSVGYF
jgi:hypothetical protein